MRNLFDGFVFGLSLNIWGVFYGRLEHDIDDCSRLGHHLGCLVTRAVASN